MKFLCAFRNPLLVAMRQIDQPPGHARDDHAIFSALAARLGVQQAFTLGRSPRDWLRAMWTDWRSRALQSGLDDAPDFDAFWQAGAYEMPRSAARPVTLLGSFRSDPVAHPLRTPSGRIELFSERVAGFGYADCPGQPTWFEPAEWLGSALAQRFALHLVSDQPVTRLHSQLDFSAFSQNQKVAGREPVWMHSSDAAARGINDGDVVELFNDRGACLAGALLTEAIRPGVLKLSTGAWYDPVDWATPGSPCRHGNPNVQTRDLGASSLSQGCSAQSCLVEVRKALNPSPADPFALPQLLGWAGAPRLRAWRWWH